MRGEFAAAARAALLLTLGLSVFSGALANAQETRTGSSFEGARVLSVRVVTETGKVLETNPAGLPLQPGKAYETDTERESLKQLWNSGDFADLRTEATREGEGVRIDFVVRENLYVNLVRVNGLVEPPSEAWAQSALRLSLGEPFRQSNLEEALKRLEQTLQNEGLYQAKLTPVLEAHPETHQMDIAINVSVGPRARIGAIQFKNETDVPEAELARRSKLETGKPVTSVRLDRGGERLRKYLVREGFLEARVTVRRGNYDAATNRLPLECDVFGGPKVQVGLEGAKVRGSRLRQLLPVYAEGALDEDLLQEGRRNLRDYFEREGYFDAKVQVSERQGAKQNEEVITYAVEKGKKQKLAGVSFEGNKYFSSELLSSRLLIAPGGFLSLGRFSQQLLEGDVDSLRGLYAANGFREVQVKSEVIENYLGRAGDLFVRFHITEGPQTRVAALSIHGNHSIPTEELEGVVGSTKGQPYSEYNVTSDRDNILALYFNQGFPKASFTWDAQEAGDPQHERLAYQISEGPQVRVDQVLLAGYHYTRPGTIEREVQIRAGQPLREGEVVDTQRRLYNLGIFSHVAIAPQNPNGTDPNKTVVVAVEEGKRYTLGYGFGFEVLSLGGSTSNPAGGSFTASPRGILEISRANFLGRADTLSFKVRASTLQYRGLLSLASPNLLANPNLSLLLTGFADKTRDVRTFTASRFEAGLQVNQRVNRITSFTYRYAFRHVLVDPGSLRVPIDEVPLLSQPTKVSEIGANWLRDRRDNPADATRGGLDSVDLNVAAKSYGSTAGFVRLFVQNSTFHPFGRKLVFARSVRFGVEPPTGKTQEVQIALPERFFAGGGATLRGFGLNQAGPRDTATGFPLGGLALLVLNNEFRFPMRLPYFGSNVAGVLFYDAGNVFTDVGSINLRWKPPSPTNLNFFSHTVGFGIRYPTPIGPLRLDLGYLLNPAVFQFQTDPNNPATKTFARLPRVQFSFSIGSIF